MPQQNIYDDEIFFSGYKKLRTNENNANNLFETPALFSLLANLEGKVILDLGCGYGDHCTEFIHQGLPKLLVWIFPQKCLQ